MDSAEVVATSYVRYGDEAFTDCDSKRLQVAIAPEYNVNADIGCDSISLVDDVDSKESKTK